mmetsp:Transcript_68217/g.120701  ORF Transcript_68217/g.120701 Transcript_68217/m.120701 type:complete len:86 (+) Transcript_68217:199-456(+)
MKMRHMNECGVTGIRKLVAHETLCSFAKFAMKVWCAGFAQTILFVFFTQALSRVVTTKSNDHSMIKNSGPCNQIQTIRTPFKYTT